jgi:hypothetical protein
MLRALPAYRSGESPIAYPVPFLVDRTDLPRVRLTNASMERLHGITFALLGPGTMPSLAPMAMPAGATITVPVRGDDLARATVLVVRWFRQSGDEYLWRVSF